MSDESLRAMWIKKNNAGEGFPIGASTDEPLKAVRRAGWEILGILDPHYPEEMILAKHPSGKIVGVCDSHGPWGCILDGFDDEK